MSMTSWKATNFVAWKRKQGKLYTANAAIENGKWKHNCHLDETIWNQ